MTSADPGLPAPRVLYVAEPPAVWLQRPPVVTDCGVLAAQVFAEQSSDEAAVLLSHKTMTTARERLVALPAGRVAVSAASARPCEPIN